MTEVSYERHEEYRHIYLHTNIHTREQFVDSRNIPGSSYNILGSTTVQVGQQHAMHEVHDVAGPTILSYMTPGSSDATSSMG